MPSLRPAVAVLAAFVAAAVVTLGLGVGATAAHAGSGARLLGYLPDEVDAALSLNVAKGRGTPLLRQGLQIGAAEFPEVWQAMRDMHFEPGKDLDTAVVASMRTKGDGERRFVAVLDGRLAGLEHALQAQPSTSHLGIAVWTFGETAIFVIDKRAVLCSSALLDAVIDTIKGKRGSVRSSRKAKLLRAGIAAANPRGDVWLVAQGKAVSDVPLPVPGSVAWISLSAVMGKGAVMSLRVQTDGDATATAAVDWLASQAPMVKQLLDGQGLGSMADSFEAKNTGPLLAVGFVMTDAELSKVLSLLSPHATAAGSAKSP